MIYILAANYREFQGFMADHYLREHLGSGGNREGQVIYLGSYYADIDKLRGTRGIVLVWNGSGIQPDLYDEVQAYCRANLMPFVVIEDLRRQAYIQRLAGLQAREP